MSKKSQTEQNHRDESKILKDLLDINPKCIPFAEELSERRVSVHREFLVNTRKEPIKLNASAETVEEAVMYLEPEEHRNFAKVVVGAITSMEEEQQLAVMYFLYSLTGIKMNSSLDLAEYVLNQADKNKISLRLVPLLQSLESGELVPKEKAE